MQRKIVGRLSGALYRVIVLAVSALLASCGGGGDGAANATKTSSAVVNDTNQAPTLSPPDTLLYLEGTAEAIALTAVDPDDDALAFSILSGLDGELFSMSRQGSLSFRIPPDYENPLDGDQNNEYKLSVRVTDGNLGDAVLVSIRVVDAIEGRVGLTPIAGATVFLDLNRDAIQNASEPELVTNRDGTFFFDPSVHTDTENTQIIARGGADAFTQRERNNRWLISDLAENAASTLLTPLSSVLALTPDQDKELLLTNLGVNATANSLISTDYWNVSNTESANKSHTRRINQKIGIMLDSAVSVIDISSDNTPLAAVFLTKMAQEIGLMGLEEGAFLPLTTTQYANLVNQSLAAIDQPELLSTAEVESVSSLISAVVNVIDDPVNPDSDEVQALLKELTKALDESLYRLQIGALEPTDFANIYTLETLVDRVMLTDNFPDLDGDQIPDEIDADDDGDNVIDSLDAFPTLAAEWADSDGDGVGDNEQLASAMPETEENLADSTESTDEIPTSEPDVLVPDDTNNDNGADDSGRHITLGNDTDRDGLVDAIEADLGKNPTISDYDLKSYYAHSCVKTDEGIRCWGFNNYGEADAPILRAQVVDFDVGYRHSCAIHGEERSIKCWGNLSSPNNGAFDAGGFKSLSSGSDHVCGLNESGQVLCHGSNVFGQASAPDIPGTVQQIAAGSRHTCALYVPDEAAANVVCWGRNNQGQSDVPAFSSAPVFLVAGSEHNCVITAQSDVECWGRNDSGQTTPPPLTAATTLGLGRNHSCAIDNSGIVCWGLDSSMLTPPAVAHPSHVSGGQYHSCALHAQGVSCWGNNFGDAINVPSDLIFNDFDGDGIYDIGDTQPLDFALQ